MNKRIKKKKQKIENKYLCERYPFLIPRNRWTDKVDWAGKYSYTELYAMGPGWRETFGMQMMEELREELIKYDYLDKFRIMQIKEKYGSLRFYCGAVPKDSKIYEIIDKYEEMSGHICERCGRPSEIWKDGGWLTTYCPSCTSQMENSRRQWHENYKKRSEK